MTSRTIVVPSGSAERNNRNEIVIPFDHKLLSNRPIVLLTPSWSGQKTQVAHIPTVSGIVVDEQSEDDLKGRVTIVDKNEASNYYLNILIVHPKASQVHGAAVIGNINPKPGTRQDIGNPNPNLSQLDVTGVGDSNSVDLLTPYWEGHHGAVRLIETVNKVSGDVVNTYSTNQGSDYNINHISLKPTSIQHAIQAGNTAKTSGNVHRVEFSEKWNTPPVVFVTPYWQGKNQQVRNIETMTTVTE